MKRLLLTDRATTSLYSPLYHKTGSALYYTSMQTTSPEIAKPDGIYIRGVSDSHMPPTDINHISSSPTQNYDTDHSDLGPPISAASEGVVQRLEEEEANRLIYRHSVQPVPIYVLDRLANAQINEKDIDLEKNDYYPSGKTARANGKLKQDDTDSISSKDPFNERINSWGSFLSALQHKTVFANEHVLTEEDAHKVFKNDLYGEWRGATTAFDDLAREAMDDDSIRYSRRAALKERVRQNTKLRQEKLKEGDNNFTSARFWLSEETRARWKPKLMKIMLNNPHVPLSLRAITFIFTVCALGLAGAVFVHSKNSSHTVPQQPSTIMAICVQSIALVYLVWITSDEYSSKQLGLRDPAAKMRLIMLDLLFIIFSSANLSLTFNTLYDKTWVCTLPSNSDRNSPYIGNICSRQRGLAGILFLVLCMWVMTFTVSIFRLVERVSQ